MTTETANPSFTDEFWSALHDGRLVVQRCRACKSLQMYPRARCVTCGSSEIDYESVSGAGTLYSFSTVMKYAPSAFADQMPYTLGIVLLAEGPRMLSWVVNCDMSALKCDMKLDFAPIVVNERLLPGFEPA